MIFVKDNERVEVNNSNLFSLYKREGYVSETDVKAEPLEETVVELTEEEPKQTKGKRKKE